MFLQDFFFGGIVSVFGNTSSYLKSFILNKKTSPNGAVNFMILGLENHKIPFHYDLHLKTFNSYE